MKSKITRPLSVLCLVMLFTTPLMGQESHWNTIPVDASLAVISKRSNTLAVQQPTHVLLYSAILHQWTWVNTSPSAVVTAQNEHALIEDNSTIHGWSCRRGVVDSIIVSSSGYVVPGPSSANYTVLVHDNQQVHAFGAYVGHWATLNVTTSNPSIFLDRSCALVIDGNTGYAFSAYYNTWEAFPLSSSPVNTGTNGNLAYANTGTDLQLFSAITNQWRTLSVQDTTQFHPFSRYSMLMEDKKITAFSCHMGTFASHLASGPNLTVDDGTQVAGILDPNGSDVICYSAIQNSFSTVSMTAPYLYVKTDYVIIESTIDQKVQAFSGALGAFSSAISGVYNFYTDASVAFAEGSSGDSFAYGSIHNQWIPAPSNTFTNVDLANTSVILTLNATDFVAFTARSPLWVELNCSTPASLHSVHSKGTVAIVSDSNALYAWDPRVGRWAGVSTQTSLLTSIEAKFGTVLAEDGMTGFGFGVYNGMWDTVQINGPVYSFDPGSGAGFIQTDNFLHVYSRSGSLTTVPTYPEASALQKINTTLKITQNAIQGSYVFLGVDTEPGYSLTPVGPMFLKNFTGFYLMPQVPASGRLDINLFVPNDPLLIGQSFHLQNLVWPPTNIPYLTNSVSIVTL